MWIFLIQFFAGALARASDSRRRLRLSPILAQTDVIGDSDHHRNCYSHEMSHSSPPAALNGPLRGEIAHYRHRNQLALGKTASVCIPLGVVFTSIAAGGAMLYAVAGVCALIALVAAVPLIKNPPAAISASQTEFKDGDFPAVAYWAPLLPIAAPLLASPLADSFPEPSLDPLLQVLLGGLYLGLATALALWSMFSRAYRVGRRRLARILSQDSLDGVTDARLQAVTDHSNVIAALCACGAVDGNEASVGALSKLSGIPVAQIEELLPQLSRLGVINVNQTGALLKPKKWQVSLTEAGIRCMGQLNRLFRL